MRFTRAPFALFLGVAALTTACNSTPSQPTPARLNIAGSVMQSTFPAPVTAITVLQGDKSEVKATPAVDGSFKLSVPKGDGYRMELRYGAKAATLVFPRAGGRLDHTFDVRSGTVDFDVGAVRYVGDPAKTMFALKAAKADQPASAEGSSTHECEDGLDAKTGAVCIDDNNEDVGASCGNDEGEGKSDEKADGKEGHDKAEANAKTGDGKGEAEDGDTNQTDCNNGIDTAGKPCKDDDGKDKAERGDADKVQCANGVDPAGKKCANDDDDDAHKKQAGAEEAGGETPTDAAVGSKNLPGVVGCADDENNNENED